MPTALFGILTLELAKTHAGKGLLGECSTRLDQADAAFEACGHSHGSLEVNKYRLHYGLSPSPNALLDLIKIIEHFCQVDYPLGVLQSTSFPLQEAFNRGDFRTYFNLQRVFHDVCKIAGVLYERLLLEIQLLASLNASTGHYGKVKELGMALYDECVMHRYWSMAFYVGQILSLAENQIANHEQAQVWATTAFELCKREALEAESVAAYNLAHIRSFIPDSSTTKTIELANDIISSLEPYVEQDLNTKEIRCACEKLCLIATLKYKIARLATNDSSSLFESAKAVLDRTLTISEALHGTDRAIIRGNCEEMRVTQLLYEGKRSANNTKEEEAIHIIDSLIVGYNSSGLTIQEANKYQFRAMCNVQMWQKDKQLKFIVAAEESYQVACQKFQAISSFQFFLGCRHQLCRLYVTAWEIYGLPLTHVLQELKAFESVADNIRRELSALGSLPALLQKQQFAATATLRDLYDWAIGVCSVSQDIRELWLWSQKRKARSLSDMLGLGVIMPANVKQALSAEPDAEELFEKLSAAQSRLIHTAPNERGFVRQEIDDLESKIRGFPVFRDYLALRDGALSGVEQIKTLINRIPPSAHARKIIFVDWIMYRDEIYMLAVNSSSSLNDVQFFKLDMTVTSIKRWIQQHFSTNEDRKTCLNQDSIRDPNCPLRALDPLIANLQKCTDKDDLLLLSPTGLLFALPLHALKIWDEALELDTNLIARNPIVYIPSMSVLEICLSRIEWEDQTGISIFLGVFDKKSEAKNIYSQVARLAQDFHGKAACGQEVSKSTFGTLTKGARLIHFHGHCEFSATNVLQQSLVLSKPEEDAEPVESMASVAYDSLVQPAKGYDSKSSAQEMPNEENNITPTIEVGGTHILEGASLSSMDLSPVICTAGEEDTMLHLDSSNEATNLTVEEIFTLPLSSPLVTLIACASTSQTIATGDEPLGIVAGLLCAGAASVVGASWPVQSGTGRSFSDHFYREIREAEGDMVDLAVALQKAVLNVRDGKRTSGTYHWAAFTLYGSWLFRK
jgi:CHAT domain-containing protein